MTTLRIGFDIGKALGVSDGLATASRLLLRSLLEIDRDNEYHLFDLHHPALDEGQVAAVFPSLPANAHLGHDRSAAAKLDLFHAPAHRVPPLLPPRLVYTLHDLTFLSHPILHTLRNRVDTLLSTTAAVTAGAHFIAVSQHTRTQAVELLGLDPGRVTVVPWAADPLFRPSSDPALAAAVRARLGLDRPYLLSVGSLEPRKNLVALVDAFGLLPEAVRDRHALVVVGGAGWRNQAILDRLESAAAGSAVVRLGEVPLSDLVALYNGALALVYPSLAEGFGLPVLEAMACGCPVVTSSVTALPEVAGDAALLVDPSNTQALTAALAKVLGDPDLRQDLSRRGLDRAREFSWRRTAEETLAVYRRCCPGGRGV